jgi:hypothetical protein
MSALTKLSYPLAILAAFALAPAPAHAQFEGAGDQMAQFAPMMEQFAPMMEQVAPMMQRVTGKIGKKRVGQIMQMAAPMMLSMMAPGGKHAGHGKHHQHDGRRSDSACRAAAQVSGPDSFGRA